MKANIAFVSLGCDKNRVDSEVMLGILRERGYTIVSDETEQLDAQALERIASCGPSQKRDGLGLGLSIVRSIISAHGGSIHFSARADKGLEVHIILPLPGGSS